MIDADAPFRWMWDKLPDSQKPQVRGFFKEVLEPNYFIYQTYEEVEDAAREMNMINRDEVRQIASDELGMIEGLDS